MLRIVLLALEALIASGLALGINRYSDPSVTRRQKLLVLAALMLPFTCWVLVLLDSYQMLYRDTQIELVLPFKLLFWALFANAWILLPLLRNFSSLEGLHTRDRIKGAVRGQLLPWAVEIAVLAPFLWHYSAGPDGLGWQAVVIALHNSLGFVLLIVSLGYAFVTMPKFFAKHRLTPEAIDRKQRQINQMQRMHEDLRVAAELEYRRISVVLKGDNLADEGLRRQLQRELRPEILADLPPVQGEDNEQIKSYNLSIVAIQHINHRYITSQRRIEELREDMDYYYLHRDTFKFKLRNFVFKNLLINSVVYSLVVFAIETLIPIQFKFYVYFFQQAVEKTSLFFVYSNLIPFALFMVVCVVYANVELRLGPGFSLERKFSPLNSLLFFATLTNKKYQPGFLGRRLQLDAILRRRNGFFPRRDG